MVGVKRTLVAAFLIAACIFIVATKPVTSENEKIINMQKGNVKLSVPSQINYQGYLCNASDTSAYSGTVDMTFRLSDSETDGVVWWVENHTSVEVVKGLFSVNLGENNAIPAPLFDGSIWWLEIVVDGEVLSPRKKLVSVGYSYRSQIADTSYHSVYVDSVSTPLTLSDSLYGTVLEVENKWGTPSECQGIKVNSGGIGIAVSNSEWAGVWVGNTASHAYSMQSADKCGLYVYDAGWDGVNVVSAGDNGIEVSHAGKNGLFINRADSSGISVKKAVKHGVYVDSVSYTYGGDGFTVRKAWTAFKALNPLRGMYIHSPEGDGIMINNSGSNAIEINMAGKFGLKIDFPDSNAIQITNPGGEALHIDNSPKSAIHVENADIYGIQIDNAKEMGIYSHGKKFGAYLTNDTNGIYYPALVAGNNHGTTSSERIATFTATGFEKFYFQGDGNAYADGGWNTFKKNSKDKYESFSAVETAYKEIIDHGKGRLSGGETYIEFNPSFSEFISTDVPVDITVTPIGSYSGIYIESYNRNGFYVKSEIGDLNCEFNWIAIGRENGYEERAEVGNIEEESRKIIEMMEKMKEG
jgi:hypothetical protein